MVEGACYSVLLCRKTQYYCPVLSVASEAGCADGESSIKIRSNYCSPPRVKAGVPCLRSSVQQSLRHRTEGSVSIFLLTSSVSLVSPEYSLPPSSFLFILPYSPVLQTPLSSPLVFLSDIFSLLLLLLCPLLPCSLFLYSLPLPLSFSGLFLLPPSSSDLFLLPLSSSVFVLPFSSTFLPSFIPPLDTLNVIYFQDSETWLLTLTLVLASASLFLYWCHSSFLLDSSGSLSGRRVQWVLHSDPDPDHNALLRLWSVVLLCLQSCREYIYQWSMAGVLLQSQGHLWLG